MLETLWRDPATGQLWVYDSNDKGGNGRPCHLHRIPAHLRGQSDYGDGTTGEAPQHTYTKDGEYIIKLGDRTGKVFVTAQEPPRLVSARMQGPLCARRTFSERMQLTDATATLASRNPVETPGDDRNWL